MGPTQTAAPRNVCSTFGRKWAREERWRKGAVRDSGEAQKQGAETDRYTDTAVEDRRGRPAGGKEEEEGGRQGLLLQSGFSAPGLGRAVWLQPALLARPGAESRADRGVSEGEGA